MCNLNYRVGRDSLFRICINIFFGHKVGTVEDNFSEPKRVKKGTRELTFNITEKRLQGQNTKTNLFVTYIRSLHRKVADINWIS